MSLARGIFQGWDRRSTCVWCSRRRWRSTLHRPPDRPLIKPPQARCWTSRDGEIKAGFLTPKNSSLHAAFFFHFYVQQGSSQVHQQHFVDQEGRKLLFSLTVAEHVGASSACQRHGSQLSFLRSSFLGHFCRSEFGYLPAVPGTELLLSVIFEASDH